MKKIKNKNLITDFNSNFYSELWQGFRLACTNLWRNSFLSLATVLVIAIMICIFNSILAVNFISKQALTNLNQKVDLLLYLKDDIEYFEASNLANQIKQIEGVKSVNYISKQKALEIISKSYPETTNFFQKYSIKNPLPPSLSITTTKAEVFQSILNQIKASPYHDKIVLPDNKLRNEESILSSTAVNLVNINNFVNQLIFWIVFIFIIGGALIVISSIQLTIFTRRQEIYVMRLVGATPFFIKLPFLIEGAIYAVFATIISFIMLATAGRWLGPTSLEFLKGLESFSFLQFFFLELLITISLSLISSYLTVDHHLRSKLTSSN